MGHWYLASRLQQPSQALASRCQPMQHNELRKRAIASITDQTSASGVTQAAAGPMTISRPPQTLSQLLPPRQNRKGP